VNLYRERGQDAKVQETWRALAQHVPSSAPAHHALARLAVARDLLGLTDTEADVTTKLQRGVALWKVGQRSFLVEHRLSAAERWIVDTDARMAGEEVA